MKSIKSIILPAVIALLATFTIISCQDINDWDVDNAYARLFTVTRAAVSPGATDAEMSWTGNKEVEYYVIEVSKDTLYDAIQMGSGTGAIIYGEDKSITKSPYTLTGLDSSTKYYVRIKGMSSTVAESKWAYYSEYHFTTKSEQIMEAVSAADISAREVILHWLAGAAVTRMEVIRTTDNAVVQDLTLTDEQKADGEITITGLEPRTGYRINLYNNEVVRGYSIVTTAPDVPAADKVIYLQSNVINQDFFDLLGADTESETFTVVFEANQEYYSEVALNLPNNKAITFFGLPGEKAVWGITQLNLAANHGYIRFENLNLSSTVKKLDNTVTESNYIFNQSNATEVDLLEFKGCTIGAFKNSPMRTQGNATKMFKTIMIDDCFIRTNGPSNNYGIIHLNEGGRTESITLSNSTVWRESKYVLYMAKFNPKTVTIKDCTFSKVSKASQYFIDFGGTSNGPSESFIIENSIFGSTADSSVKGIRSKVAPTIINSYSTTDWVTGGNHIADLTSYSGSEADLFMDPANGDFTIKDSGFSGRRSVGDPRWYMPE